MTTTTGPGRTPHAAPHGRGPRREGVPRPRPGRRAFLVGAAAAGVTKLGGEMGEILALKAAHGDRAAGRAGAGGHVPAVAGR